MGIAVDHRLKENRDNWQRDTNAALPLGMMDIYELTRIFMYVSETDTTAAIRSGRFPIPVFKRGRRIYALRSIVREYFMRQHEIMSAILDARKQKLDLALIRRQKKEEQRKRKSAADEISARRAAQKDQKRREAVAGKRLADARKARETAARGIR
jgi:hypothetical protein